MPLSPKRRPSLSLPKLYAIVDTDACAKAAREPLAVAQAFLSAGVRFLQLRAKTLDSGPFLELAEAVVSDARKAGAIVIVNDRADVAAFSHADGVHVGQDDLTPDDVRLMVGSEAIVGLSTHVEDQWLAALEQPISYVAIGPVYGTRTKHTGYDAVGIATVGRVADAAVASGSPVVAIGGITIERAPEVIAAGAASVAVITGLLNGDPEARARAFLDALA